ncbi:hypothetical protein ACH4TP_12925 [Streptomyces sp. NPDC021012]
MGDPPVRHLHDIPRNGALFRRRWGQWPMEGRPHAFAGTGPFQAVYNASKSFLQPFSQALQNELKDTP